ncbi:MAG: hypothetical protein RL641_9 [Candidatus Parcubacteria bacterium]|jgi:hypothetical protein
MRLPTYALFFLPAEIIAVNTKSGEKISLPLSPSIIKYAEITDAASYETLLTEKLTPFFSEQGGECAVVLHESFGYLETVTKPLRNLSRQELLALAAYAPIAEDKLAFSGFTDTKSKIRRAVFFSSSLILPITAILKKTKNQILVVLPLAYLQITSELKDAFASLSYETDDGDDQIRFAHNVLNEIFIKPEDPVVAKREKKRSILLVSVASVFMLTALLYTLYASGVIG